MEKNEKIEELIKNWAESIVKEAGGEEFVERGYFREEEGYYVMNMYERAKKILENPESWKEQFANMYYEETGWEDADITASVMALRARLAEKQISMAKKIAETKTVVTHFGQDLDNVSSTYALELWAKQKGILDENEKLKIDRVPAGKVKEGYLNVDTGGHTGSEFGDDTIVIDGDPKQGINSASATLREIIGIIPKQIAEVADTRPAKISILETRTPLSLMRYLTPEKMFELAEKVPLGEPLSDEQLEEYGLVEAHAKQQGIIDKATEKINQYTVELPNGEKIVLAKEQITAGSGIAYELGIPYYASANQHLDKEGNPDGVTFAISCKPGMKLPEKVTEFGNELVEQYRIDEKTSGVFVHPNGQMIVAGGPKNPDFKIEGYTLETILEQIENSFEQDRSEKHDIQEVKEVVEQLQEKDINNTLQTIVTEEKQKEEKQEENNMDER